MSKRQRLQSAARVTARWCLAALAWAAVAAPSALFLRWCAERPWFHDAMAALGALFVASLAWEALGVIRSAVRGWMAK